MALRASMSEGASSTRGNASTSSRQAWCEYISESGVRRVVTAVSTACAIASNPAAAVTCRGRRARELGIENRNPDRRRRIAAGHLHVRGGVGNHGVALGLAARAGGRRDAQSSATAGVTPSRIRDSPR